MEKMKFYEAPKVKRVRLDVKSSVMGLCQQSPDNIVAPTCVTQIVSCPTVPNGS